MNDILWTPDPARVAAAAMTRFRHLAEAKSGRELADYDALWQWSIDDREGFWSLLWDFCDVISSTPHDAVLENGDAMPGARWFPGARLNLAENLLRRRDACEGIVCWRENGTRSVLSFAELYDSVSALRAWLQARGVGEGDRVAGFLPNLPETIAAMLATASLGAVWSSCSPDFGTRGVLDRFGQIEPKALICADGYFYGGKTFDSRPRVAEILVELSSVVAVVVVPYVEEAPDLSSLRDAASWGEATADVPAGDIAFTQVAFDHPLFIMYSSGTTGAPKCIVHGHGGTLLQHLKEHRLHCDLQAGDRLFYFSTCGWMMWNWQVSGLAIGATLMLYEGNPAHPSPSILWDFCEQERISVFGTSAKYISAIEKAGVKPAQTHDLSRMRLLMSTGSPLAHESYDYVYRDIKQNVQLSSISGGTDIVSCFALGNPVLPVRKGEIQSRGLGMAVDVFGDDGKALPAGEKGELVCTRAFPSMPVGFWNDPDGAKYHAAYFDTFDNIWRHGDWSVVTETSGMVIYGRSDAVLNPGGVRIGTAEIYRQVEQFDEVLESLCIGQDWDDDVRVVLFVVMRPGHELGDELIAAIRQKIRTNASPRHMPARVIAVADIPRTRSNKISELAVRDIVHGRAVKNTEALANPEALKLFAGLAALAD
ncbi:MAG: acetoacetate--CoA ligase [Alphaproteobacteria bacterium]|nr:acetoacetate--CoA ligase [Rhodospirillaceae bacterium]MBT7611644.1 acetoacetate--CoA ligase [Rhodospirillaceae bacterium]MDG2480140.1 acetoacetate--CoA ligase [Alphaproteobacteria bacterium]